MATTTTFSPAHVGTARAPGRGLFTRILQHMIRAREAEARRRVASVLYTHSDETLKTIGLTREELARWHSGAADQA
jgi:hypothetical protein